MNKTTLVLGASLKPDRYSNIVINRLRGKDHEVKAFGLKTGEINNVPIDTELISYNDICPFTTRVLKFWYQFFSDVRIKS